MNVRRAIRRWLWRLRPDLVLAWKGLDHHAMSQDREFCSLFMSLCDERRLLASMWEAYNLHCLVRQMSKLPGDIAEVGVYRGGSARLICQAKGSKQLHLFDTFEGMPAVDEDVDVHRAGDFADTSLESVQAFLAGQAGVHFHRGFFPGSAEPLARDGPRFCLVNLDVDIYQSTLSGLTFFYERMSRGGVILSHDYYSLRCPGVKKAFDEFLADKPEVVSGSCDTQGFFVKL